MVCWWCVSVCVWERERREQRRGEERKEGKGREGKGREETDFNFKGWEVPNQQSRLASWRSKKTSVLQPKPKDFLLQNSFFLGMICLLSFSVLFNWLNVAYLLVESNLLYSKSTNLNVNLRESKMATEQVQTTVWWLPEGKGGIREDKRW